MKVFIYIKPKKGETENGCIVIENAVRTCVDANGAFHAQNAIGTRWNIPRVTIHMIEMVE
jgi:hypothetical protein